MPEELPKVPKDFLTIKDDTRSIEAVKCDKITAIVCESSNLTLKDIQLHVARQKKLRALLDRIFPNTK